MPSFQTGDLPGVLRAAGAWFVIAVGADFLLGAIHVLLVAPALGELLAVVQ